MEDRKFCRRCLLEECDEAEILEKIQKLLAMMPDAQKAPEAEYRRRLQICKSCDSLINAQCMKCGCYVELRAAKRKERCPHEKKYWQRFKGNDTGSGEDTHAI